MKFIKLNSDNYKCEILLDVDTGVEYIYYNNTAITPRLGKDGKPLVLSKEEILEKIKENDAENSKIYGKLITAFDL